MDDAALAALAAAARAVGDVGAAALVGAFASAALLARAAPSSAWAAQRGRRLWAAASLAAAAALAASFLSLLARSAAMADSGLGDAIGALPSVLGDTVFGRAVKPGLEALAALVLVCAGSAKRRRAADVGAPAGSAPARWRWALAGACILLFAFSRAAAGHAGASLSPAQLAATVTHLLATWTWAGLVLAAALAVLPARGDAHGRPDDDPATRADRARYLAGLSRLAAVALALVAATGPFLAWRMLGGRLAPLVPAAAFGGGAPDGTAPWAAVLDLKIALAAAAAALGAVNRFAFLPSLRRGPDGAARAGRRFVAVIRIEAVLLLAAVAAGGILADSPPPTDQSGGSVSAVSAASAVSAPRAGAAASATARRSSSTV
jgi:putative copper resistance protein D